LNTSIKIFLLANRNKYKAAAVLLRGPNLILAGTHVLIAARLHRCLLHLLKEGVRYPKESLTSQLLIEGLHICVDSGERNVGEIGKVLSDRDVQGVRAIENIRVSLQISSSIILMLGLSVGIN
jgi:hypothetical protein